jgi:hypothetical protein
LLTRWSYGLSPFFAAADGPLREILTVMAPCVARQSKGLFSDNQAHVATMPGINLGLHLFAIVSFEQMPVKLGLSGHRLRRQARQIADPTPTLQVSAGKMRTSGVLDPALSRRCGRGRQNRCDGFRQAYGLARLAVYGAGGDTDRQRRRPSGVGRDRIPVVIRFRQSSTSEPGLPLESGQQTDRVQPSLEQHTIHRHISSIGPKDGRLQ